MDYIIQQVIDIDQELQNELQKLFEKHNLKYTIKSKCVTGDPLDDIRVDAYIYDWYMRETYIKVDNQDGKLLWDGWYNTTITHGTILIIKPLHTCGRMSEFGSSIYPTFFREMDDIFIQIRNKHNALSFVPSAEVFYNEGEK